MTENEKYRLFGEMVFHLLDGTEWSGDTFEEIKIAAEKCELVFHEPDEED